jgi:hypothetical protein
MAGTTLWICSSARTGVRDTLYSLPARAEVRTIVKLALVLFILTIFVLVNVFEKPIIHALKPATEWMRR